MAMPGSSLRPRKPAIATERRHTSGRCACQLTNYKNWGFIDTLSAAYAEAGDFKSAIEWETKALALASGADKHVCQERIELYKQGKAYRQ